MTPARRFLAFLSACAIALSVFAYVFSFFGAPVDKILPWSLVLFLGIIALIVPIYFLEYPASRKWNWSWKEWARGMPSWVAPCFWLLELFAATHFVWFALHSGAGVPDIIDGQYVLDSHGQIVKILTREEYLSLREAFLRVVATIMISLYFVPMMYWWFRQSRPEAS